jgi:acyl carrier protein
MSIEDKILELILKSSDKTVEDIKSANDWADTGLDSLMTVEVIMAAEDEFDIEISDENAESIKNFNQLVEFIKGKTQ